MMNKRLSQLDNSPASKAANLTPCSSVNKGAWNIESPSNGSARRYENPTISSDELSGEGEESKISLDKSIDVKTSSDKSIVGNMEIRRQQTPKVEKKDSDVSLKVTNRLLVDVSKFTPNQTFNYPNSKSRNQYENKLVTQTTKKEIMGNSWINSGDVDKMTKLKKDRSKVDLDLLEREFACLDGPMSVIDERPRDGTTNFDSKDEFRNEFGLYKDKKLLLKSSDDSNVYSGSETKNYEPSYIGHNSLSSFHKSSKSNQQQLSISDISQIQQELNIK